jgi:hypothetical protein
MNGDPRASATRAITLLALAALVGAWSAPAGGLADECAGSHGDYADSQWWDPGLECLVEIDGGDESTVNNAIEDVSATFSSDSCRAIETYLETTAEKKEWTGNYFDQYEWAAFALGDLIGFHWDEFGNSGLWAHEGSHGLYNTSENEAEHFRQTCPAV